MAASPPGTHGVRPPVGRPCSPYGLAPTNEHFIENGRGYSNFRRMQYYFPVDELEQQRLDILHTMIQSRVPKPQRLHHAPFVERRQDPSTRTEGSRVLDVGHGTAIWLLDMAQKYQNTEFIGLDLSDMAPATLFPNVDARANSDFESPWAFGESSFDYVHLSMGLGSVSNWPTLYEKIYRHLKPGGWFEHVEIDWEPRCDDGTLSSGMLRDWWHRYVRDPYDVIRRPLQYNHNTQALLTERGFTEIQHFTYRVPMNGWSADSQEYAAGTWWETAMATGDGHGYGFEALSLAVLTRIQEWTVKDARRLCEDAMRQACDPNVHAYTNLHIWIARKPTNADR